MSDVKPQGAKPLGPMAAVAVEWSPFVVGPKGPETTSTRSLNTVEGLGDRLRFVAFAEKQAKEAFYWAAEVFAKDLPEVQEIWRTISREEEKHMNWLIARMNELNVRLDERPVHDALWKSFGRCQNAVEFASFMANAEERGRIAGEKFYETLLSIDPISAALFLKIAQEEQDHIDLAEKAFGLVASAKG